MLPAMPKRDRAPKTMDVAASAPKPRLSNSVAGAAGCATPPVDQVTPLTSRCATANPSVQRRGLDLSHSSSHSASLTSGSVPDHCMLHLATADGFAQAGRGWESPRGGFLPTVADTCPPATVAARVPSPHTAATALPTGDLMVGMPTPGQISTSGQSNAAMDTQSIQLLQELQQLLRSGAPTGVLQQWVSGYLLQATSRAASPPPPPPTAAAAAVLASSQPARPAGTTALSVVALGQPISPVIVVGSRALRRPLPAVSFSLSTDSHSHKQQQQQQQQQTETQERPPNDTTTTLTEEVFTPSCTDSVRTANTSSFSNKPPVMGDGSAVSRMPVIGKTTPFLVAAQSEAETRAPLHKASQSVSVGVAVTASLERGACLIVDDPLAVTDGDDVDVSPPQSGSGGGNGLLKASRPCVQHSQWRSFRTKGSTAGCNSVTSPSGGAQSVTMTGVGAHSSTHIAPPLLPPTSPTGTPTKCRIASALHSVTKAAIHATTSQLMTEEQQSISLFIGERFSRHPQNYLRCGAASLSAGSGSSPGAQASSGATSSAVLFQGKPYDGISLGAEGDGTSGVTAEATTLQQRDVSAPTLDVSRTLLACRTHVPHSIPESGAVPAVVSGVHHVPLISTNPAAPESLAARDLISRIPQNPILPSTLATAAMETAEHDASGVSSQQGNHQVATNNRDALSPAFSSNRDGDAATRISSLVVDDFASHERRMKCASPEQPADMDTEAERKMLLHRRRQSVNLSGVVAVRSPPAAAESAAGDAAEMAVAADGSDVISLIDINPEDASASCTPTRRSPGLDASSTFSGSDCHELRRSWAEAARMSADRHHRFPFRAPIMTLPPVNAICAPSALAPQSMGAIPASNFGNSLSQYFTSPSAVAQRARPASIPPRRSTSFASMTSSHLGGGGASGETGLSAFLNLGGRSCFCHDEMPSTNSCRATCVSAIGDNIEDRCRRRASVLRLSRSSLNGGVDHTDGVMATFFLDDISGAQHRSGPRFLRSFCRHTPVRVTEGVTQEVLKALGVPFLGGIDHASEPTNVFRLMESHGFEDIRVFYVAMCLNVLLRYEFVRRFGWNVPRLKRFFEVAATYFCDGNPLHNALHAVDVVVAAHQWIGEGSTGAALTDDEVMTFLFTAMVQQLAHTGVDNLLLAHLKHPYAMLCSYASPQQGATVALLMSLLSRPELHFFPEPFLDGSDVPGVAGSADATVVPEWTISRELQMYDMLADLIIATDERNQAILKQGIVRMGEENRRRHGCLCATTPGDCPAAAWQGPSRFARQPDTAARMLYPSQQGNFCLNCCAYIIDAHVPAVLKAVLFFIEYAFLFRPYQVYLIQSVAYIAELYRQNEREYKLFQELQQEQVRKAQLGKTDEGSLGGTVLPPPSGVGRVGGASSAPSANAYTFATALLAEHHPWRQGVAQASTMTSLQRNNEEPVMGPDALFVPYHATGVVLPLESDTRRDSALESLEALEEDVVKPVASAACNEGTCSSNVLGTSSRVRPLKGLGRDIVLISIEDLCLPFLEQLSPYMPQAWVEACYRNYQMLVKDLPTPEEFDEVVYRFLDMGEETGAENTKGDCTREGDPEDGETDSITADRPFTLPWRLLRPLRPIVAEWAVSKDKLVQRVLREIMRGPQQLLREIDESREAMER